MAQHDYVLDNQSGLNFRTDLNNALQAIVSQNSGSSAPSPTYAYMAWIDTSGANPLLKIRNAANSAWVTVGRVDIDNFGIGPTVVGTVAPSTPQAGNFWVDTSGANPILKIRNVANSAWVDLGRVDIPNLGALLLTGGTVTGAVIFNSTGHVTIPVGNISQRPGSPANGMIRYNSELSQFEGYGNSTWGPLGGGGFVVSTLESIAASGTISSSTIDSRQMRRVQGNAAPVTASLTPFGATGGWRDGTEILLIGNDDTNTVTLTFNDAAKGLVGNFSTLTLNRFSSVTCVYSSALDRWIATEVF